MIELTIGFPVYSDFDGAYFSIQSMRLHQDLGGVEILVVDNFGCEATAAFVASIGAPDVRYIRYTDRSGPAAARQRIFEEARGRAVLCVDAHVLLAKGVVARLKQHFRERPETTDLYQGPLLIDSLNGAESQLEPVWDGAFFGKPASLAPLPDEPFAIGMQRLGCFSCRKDAWPGLNARLRGYSRQEFYVQQKFRQAGGQCWCLPWLRWMHRFGRPGGPPYERSHQELLFNYVVMWRELGAPLNPIYEQYLELLPAPEVARIAGEALDKQVSISISEAALPQSPGAGACRLAS